MSKVAIYMKQKEERRVSGWWSNLPIPFEAVLLALIPYLFAIGLVTRMLQYLALPPWTLAFTWGLGGALPPAILLICTPTKAERTPIGSAQPSDVPNRETKTVHRAFGSPLCILLSGALTSLASFFISRQFLESLELHAIICFSSSSVIAWGILLRAYRSF